MAPLRRLVKKGKRFVPTKQHNDAFDAVKAHLLDEKANVIRMPSQNVDDDIVLFTDASASSISCLLTQMLEPVAPREDGKTGKCLHIIGCFSSVIDEKWANFPIWLLELIALYETCRKYSWLLSARPFFAVTDSAVVVNWASLDSVPADIARKIIHLQRFQYRILFIESRMNPADCLSRISPDQRPKATYPRFLEDRIFNARGEVVPWESLFSLRKADEAKNFFQRHRRQNLSTAVSGIQEGVRKEEEEEEEEEENIFCQPDSEIINIIGDGGDDGGPLAPPILGDDAESAAEIYASVAAIGLDDDDMAEGRCEEEEDGELDEDIFSGVVLPSFSDERLSTVLQMQQDDAILDECRHFLLGTKEIPMKIEALALPFHLQDFLRHRSSFRLSPQGVIFRLWVLKNGGVVSLIVVGAAAFNDLVESVHSFSPDSSSHAAHLGRRKTMTVLSQTYYAFGMRAKINKIISMCPSCVLNSFPKGRKEDDGEQIATEPGAVVIIDYAGPFDGIGRSSTGNRRYFFLAIDACSRFIFTTVTSSTSDAETLRCLTEMRHRFCGFPRTIACDNAILTPRSSSLALLKENGVSVLHGHAYISRCQSKAERGIGTITRLITKFNTERPEVPFPRLVAEATLCYNRSPHESLPNGYSPCDVHFVRAPVSFLRTAVDARVDGIPRSLVDSIRASRLAGKETLQFDVASFLRRQELRSPTNYSRRLRVGDFALRKRTSWPTSTPWKLGFRVVIDAFRIVARVATNSFRCESIVTNEISILPGDLLVRVRGHDESSLSELVRRMNEASQRHTTGPTTAVTRSRSSGISCLFTSIETNNRAQSCDPNLHDSFLGM